MRIFLYFIFVAVFLLNGQIAFKEKAQLYRIRVQEKVSGMGEARFSELSFIFIDQPSAYYHYQNENLLTIEFHDAVLCKGEPPATIQSPFADCRIFQGKVNINRGIKDLVPDFKDVLRIDLTIEDGVKMDLTSSIDFNVVTLSTAWTKSAKILFDKPEERSKWWVWVVGGVVGATGGIIAYLMTREEAEPDTTESLPPEPSVGPPSLPSLH
jgi:hypothetical protein